jgi:hypothetical protein
LSNVAVWRSPALPRAWIVENITSLPELDDNSHSSLVRRTRKVLFENGRWRDFHRVAVVETSADAPPVTTPPSPASAAAGQCRIIADEPLRTEIEVDLARPGLLVLAVLYDASWRASYTPQGETEAQAADILRTNRVQRGVWLPPGRGRVTFVYAPRSFYLGAALSLLTWLFLLIWVGWIKVGFEKVGRLAEILR